MQRAPALRQEGHVSFEVKQRSKEHLPPDKGLGFSSRIGHIALLTEGAPLLVAGSINIAILTEGAPLLVAGLLPSPPEGSPPSSSLGLNIALLTESHPSRFGSIKIAHLTRSTLLVAWVLNCPPDGGGRCSQS